MIFRTSDGRGWGIKTLEFIPKNQFVMEYVGEIITNDEAERRGELYDAAHQTYLFDLDLARNEAIYTIDACNYGNVSHFINHSVSTRYSFGNFSYFWYKALICFYLHCLAIATF